MMNKKELKEMINKLENGVDRFILAGLFYGLNQNSNREHLLNLTTNMVDLKKSTILLPSGRVVEMDDVLREATIDAINQKTYVKMGTIGSRTNQDYDFNTSSDYIIKTKPTKKNNNGLEPLTNAGFKTRIRSISDFLTGDASALTPSDLKRAGVHHLLASQGKKLTIIEAEAILKENGLGFRRNNLIPMLKEINEVDYIKDR